MINIIKQEDSIRAAILSLHPIARDACQNMITRLPDMSNIENHKVLLIEEMFKCMAFSAHQHGLDRDDCESLIKSQGPQVITIAVSVIHLQRRNRSSGIAKGAAAVGLGIVIGVLFG
jgi:hypothetical protein